MARPDFKTLIAAESRWRADRSYQGEISLLCARPDFGGRWFPETLHLNSETGVENDRWQQHGWLRLPDGAADPRIQVAVISTALLAQVWPEGHAGDAPYPGDTMVADMDFDSARLPAGTRLQAGTAQLEVSDVFNDGCVKWKARYGDDAWRFVREKELLPRRRRGMFCRIVKSGVVKTGDHLVPLHGIHAAS